jgi:deoxyxylulose-5-phosphate synthase
VLGGMASQAFDQIRDGLKAFLRGGMLFEELGFRYIDPVDGHDLFGLRRWLREVKDQKGPILLHVLTEKEMPLVVTVKEGTLEGGFGSALLEAANAAGLDTRHIRRLGIPDRFIEHAERGELLAGLGLDADSICEAVRQARCRREEAAHES